MAPVLFYFSAGVDLYHNSNSCSVFRQLGYTTLGGSKPVFLFWIGRTKQISIYETISYVLMLLALMSILKDWNYGYSFGSRTVAVANIYFLTSLLFVAVFTFINILNQNENYPSALKIRRSPLYKIMEIVIPGILLSALFFMFWFEISSYCNQQIAAISGNEKVVVNDGLNFKLYTDLTQFRILFLLNYSILFFVGLSIFNIRILKNKVLGYINLEANLILVLLFLTQGLFSLSELRDSFLNQTSTDMYHPGSFNFNFRYISYLVVLPMLLICYRYVRQEFIDYKLDKAYSLILHTVILWILSSELITWIDFFKSDQAYKLGLSLLWGGYALLLIVLGIWKKQQQLRIGAIVLFGGTLLKLFFYDLKEMGTISRTIVFVTLGILLLIISFLYNKNKHIIWNDSSENEVISGYFEIAFLVPERNIWTYFQISTHAFGHLIIAFITKDPPHSHCFKLAGFKNSILLNLLLKSTLSVGTGSQ